MRQRATCRAAAGALVFFLAILAPPSRSPAQMMLPGANNGNAVGAPPKAAGGGFEESAAPAGLRPITLKPPAEDTIVGQTLSRDGKSGAMAFNRVGNDLVLNKLKLDGDKISKPQDGCSIDVALPSPIVTTPAGRPSGTARFEVPLEACPFTIDILDGAILVSRADPTCDFTAADCRVTPGGLWGPAAIDISSERAKDLERERQRLEATMRTNFRALIKKAGKDRAAVKSIAHDQAAFSSQREMTCRDYDQEAVHGFCSTQITQARALELLAKFGTMEEGPQEHRHVRTKSKAKAAAAAHGPAKGAQPAAPAGGAPSAAAAPATAPQ